MASSFLEALVTTNAHSRIRMRIRQCNNSTCQRTDSLPEPEPFAAYPSQLSRNALVICTEVCHFAFENIARANPGLQVAETLRACNLGLGNHLCPAGREEESDCSIAVA